MAMFKQVPLCEVCCASEATSFSRVMDPENGNAVSWKFVCLCTADTEQRYVSIGRFFANPSATTDWLAHLDEIAEMDWHSFMSMMTRFRKATDSFGAL
ncbi:MAG: hypothetical protein K2X00_23625 [Nitrospiraceae bacterium]|nr:hypothetical protein [Nitrospiraceae bacterium]